MSLILPACNPPESANILIATYHLCIVDTNSPLSTSWDVDSLSAAIREQAREHLERQQRRQYISWPEYMVYVAARDMRGVGNLMCVPAVGVGSLIVVPVVLELTRRVRAVEQHDFWSTTVQIFDPHNGYAHFGWIAARAPANSNNYSSPAPAATRAFSYRHFLGLLTYSCLPCRANAPEPPRVLAAPGPRYQPSASGTSPPVASTRRSLSGSCFRAGRGGVEGAS
ncbi:hypothetical protein B0H14DRAFT_2624686 [Mycena olivaceomarginata]|nr:hypothetical protein B0H14DRAFT_2624686 [Mycena olivaceomarginata]